jgi:excisionase family DNA binding protein
VLYTRKEAAKYLSVCVKTVNRAMGDGRLNYRKIGCSIRFTQSDLDEFVAVSSARPIMPPAAWPYPRIAE